MVALNPFLQAQTNITPSTAHVGFSFCQECHQLLALLPLHSTSIDFAPTQRGRVQVGTNKDGLTRNPSAAQHRPAQQTAANPESYLGAHRQWRLWHLFLSSPTPINRLYSLLLQCFHVIEDNSSTPYRASDFEANTLRSTMEFLLRCREKPSILPIWTSETETATQISHQATNMTVSYTDVVFALLRVHSPLNAGFWKLKVNIFNH